MESVWLQHYPQFVVKRLKRRVPRWELPGAISFNTPLPLYHVFALTANLLTFMRWGANNVAEALIAHCRANLTGYKVPKQVAFRDTLPKSPIGKILRRKLKEEGAAA